MAVEEWFTFLNLNFHVHNSMVRRNTELRISAKTNTWKVLNEGEKMPFLITQPLCNISFLTLLYSPGWSKPEAGSLFTKAEVEKSAFAQDFCSMFQVQSRRWKRSSLVVFLH